MIFVDTNYFIRFLLKDNLPQYRIAKKLFIEASEGKKSICTSTIVIFEIYWLLSTYYQKTKQEVVSVLEEILNLSFLQIENKDLITRSMAVFKKTNLDLEDSFNLVYSQILNVSHFATFDKKLLKRFSTS